MTDSQLRLLLAAILVGPFFKILEWTPWSETAKRALALADAIIAEANKTQDSKLQTKGK
jgi:hypothetical protein